jgi:hypothetical protein
MYSSKATAFNLFDYFSLGTIADSALSISSSAWQSISTSTSSDILEMPDAAVTAASKERAIIEMGRP